MHGVLVTRAVALSVIIYCECTSSTDSDADSAAVPSHPTPFLFLLLLLSLPIHGGGGGDMHTTFSSLAAFSFMEEEMQKTYHQQHHPRWLVAIPRYYQMRPSLLLFH